MRSKCLQVLLFSAIGFVVWKSITTPDFREDMVKDSAVEISNMKPGHETNAHATKESVSIEEPQRRNDEVTKSKETPIAKRGTGIVLEQNYYDHLPPLEVVVETFRGMQRQELEQEIKVLNDQLKLENWLERANAGQLSDGQRRKLAGMFQRDAALRLALIDLKLNEIMEGGDET